MASSTSTKVVTGKVRLSYVHLFERQKTDDGEEGKFSVVLLIPKSDTKTLNAMQAAYDAAAEQGKSTKFGGSIPKNLVDTRHDGDEEADLEKNPEYAGHIYVSVSSNTQPGIVDKQVNPILDPTEVYSGCYARAEIVAAPFEYKGKKGVSFYLNHVQKMAEGESLTGRTSAEDAFEPIEDEDESLLD